MSIRMKEKEAKKYFDIETVKVKRDKHPNEFKYMGRSGNEQMMALINFLNKLTKEQMDLYTKNKLVLNKQRCIDFLNELKVNDIVGIKEMQYKVLSKNDEGFVGENKWTNVEETLPLSVIDFGLETGFAEILERNGEYYGVEQTEDIKIAIPKPQKKKSNKKSVAKSKIKKTEKK